MIILRGYNISHIAAIGMLPIWYDLEYVLAKHCLAIDVNGGRVIINNLSRAIVYLDKHELNELNNIEKYIFLYKTYFFVPKNFNSNEIIDKIRKPLQSPIDGLYLDNPNEFTILTTTKCNARCFYCYEQDSKQKHHMSDITALKVAKYIDTVALKDDEIALDWFGGEPFFNIKVIDIITDYLIKKNRTFISSATSNGYLLDDALIKKAYEKWNLRSIQITIDGTEKVYNKAKNYIYKKDSSPYLRVMKNIQSLLDLGIKVAIRLNIDTYNIEDVKTLIGEIFTRFGIHPNLSIYVWPLFDDISLRSEEEENIVYKGLEELENLITEYGYILGGTPEESIKASHCMADCGSHVLISADGELGTCEHYINEDYFSNIDNPKVKDYKIMEGWRKYEQPLNICQDCPIYANCLRPSKCVEMRKCSEHIKKWKIRKATFELLNFYNINKNNI